MIAALLTVPYRRLCARYAAAAAADDPLVVADADFVADVAAMLELDLDAGGADAPPGRRRELAATIAARAGGPTSRSSAAAPPPRIGCGSAADERRRWRAF